jgi:hypothetical protein
MDPTETTDRLSEDIDLVLTALDDPSLEENFDLENTDPALPVPDLDDTEGDKDS